MHQSANYAKNQKIKHTYLKTNTQIKTKNQMRKEKLI